MGKSRRVLLFLVLVGLVFGSLGWVISQAEAKNVAPVLNAYAPEFILKDLYDTKVDLKNVVQNHQVTLVNFWATWCPPCKGEIPELNRIYSEYASKSVTIIGVNLQEDAQTLRPFVKEHSMKFPVLRDFDGKIGGMYQVYYIPETFVIDHTGKIRQVIQGGTTYDTLKKAIDNLLKEG